jgi:hypothetical protein
MDENLSSVTSGTALGRLAGTWRGTNGFRLMPADELHHAPATAVLTTVAGGYDVVLTYTWQHPGDGPQDGVLLVGSPDEDQRTVAAAWGDSWHQKPSIRTLEGTLTDGRLDIAADSGGGFRWTISLEGENPLLLTMHNVVPDEYATDEVEAGPYPVMVAELRRDV